MKSIGLSYLKKNGKGIVFYVGFSGILYLVLFLYNVRQDALTYMVVLAGLFCLCGSLLDFFQYYRHFQNLLCAVKGLPEEINEFPKPEDLTEGCYQKCLADLYRLKQQMESDMRIGKQEMQDYYGLWAHQIKTPISAMNLLLQSMEDMEGREKDQAVKELKLELFKTEQYVEMVLSYLRMEDLSSDLMLCWYKIDMIIRQAVRKYSQMFILKKIRLDYEPCEQMVLTDEKWMLFVLEQVLSNALKYTKEGTISIYTEPKDGHVLVIEDTGIGISEEDLPRVFEKGFTGYNGRQDKKSTGIGLYLCKSICTKLNHTISISSVPGKGTKVKLDFSRKEVHYE